MVSRPFLKYRSVNPIDATVVLKIHKILIKPHIKYFTQAIVEIWKLECNIEIGEHTIVIKIIK